MSPEEGSQAGPKDAARGAAPGDLRSPLEHLGSLAASAAAAIAFVYLTGGAVMSVRFQKAGLPIDQSIAALPREVLLAVGLRRLLVPAVAAGLFFFFLGRVKAQLLARRRNVAVPAQRSIRQLAYICFALTVVAITTPFSLSALLWVGAFACVALYDWLLTRRWASGHPTARYPAYRVGIVGLVAVSAVAVAVEYGGPVALETASVETKDGRTITGYYVSSRQQEGVYIGVGPRLMIIPRDDVKSLTLERPPRERSRDSILQRLWPDPKSPFCPQMPNVDVAFSAETHSEGVVAREGARRDLPVTRRFSGACQLGFIGACLGESVPSLFTGTPDARWFVLPASLGVISSATVRLLPSQTLSPVPCRDEIVPPTEMTWTAPTDPAVSGNVRLAVNASRAPFVGFATRYPGSSAGSSSGWKQIGVDRELSPEHEAETTWDSSTALGEAVSDGTLVPVIAVACAAVDAPLADVVRFFQVRQGNLAQNRSLEATSHELDADSIAVGRRVGCQYSPSLLPPRSSQEGPTTLLGNDLAPLSVESCRSPGSSTGSAWQRGSVQLGGIRYTDAYYCNLPSGGAGSLEFDLGRAYRELRMTIGLTDDSPSVDHRVRFSVIADGREFLSEPRLVRFGETASLAIDVTGILRLRLEVHDTSEVNQVGPSARAAWANLVLVAA